MASAREKFNNKGGGVPSLFSYTIKDTQKLGEGRFPSKSKYIKNDIKISKGIESKDSDLEGLGDVIKKVKKEDVHVPAGAIRKHKMVKQISGRFNSEGKKKGFDIFALIDDAIDKEPTEEAKEKARERAAAKNAVNEPLPPRVVTKRNKVFQSTSPEFLPQSTEGDITPEAMDEPVVQRRALDAAAAETPTSVPAMFATNTNGSIPKREPAWKLRLQDKKQNASASTHVLAKQNSSSLDQVDKAISPPTVVKEIGANTAGTERIPSQTITMRQTTSFPDHVDVIRKTHSPKEENFEFNEGQIACSSDVSREDGLGDSVHVAVTNDAPDKSKSDLIEASSPVTVAVPEEVPKDGLEGNRTNVASLKDTNIPEGANLNFNGDPAAVAVGREIKPTPKEPAWKLRLQEKQAASSSDIDAAKGTNIASAPNAGTLVANVESRPLKKPEPAWKLRLQERQATSTITEPVPPLNHDVSRERGVSSNEGKVDAQNNQLKDPPDEAPDDDDFSVSISSVESDQSHDEQIQNSGVGHVETVEQVVARVSQKEPESCSVQGMKYDVEDDPPLSEKCGMGQPSNYYDEPQKNSLQDIECAVENIATPPKESNMGGQFKGTAVSLEAESVSLSLTLGASPRTTSLLDQQSKNSNLPLEIRKYCDDSDTSDSSSDDDSRIPIAPNVAATRKSDSDTEMTRSLQAPKFTTGLTAYGFPLIEKVDTLLAQSIPAAPHSVTATGTCSPSDKLEWLREQIKDTEKKLQATTVDAKLQVAELRKLFDNEKETMQDDFEERIREQRKLTLEQDKKHEKLLNEEKKIVESLRAENKMLRANVDRLPKQMAETKQSIANLEAANKEIATHTEDLHRFTKKLEADHEKLTESSQQCRDIYLPRYRRELRDRQMALDTETRIKTLYRDCAIKIAKHIGESSRKPDLIEEINALVLETEAEVNPKFDPRVLVASDSDSSSSSSSSDSDDSSDSDSSSD